MIKKPVYIPVIAALLTLPAAVTVAQWNGFENILATDSGLVNAAFSIDPTFVTHLHVGGAAAGDVNDDGVFSDTTAQSGLTSPIDAHSIALADIGGSGQLDLAVAYWERSSAAAIDAGYNCMLAF